MKKFSVFLVGVLTVIGFVGFPGVTKGQVAISDFIAPTGGENWLKGRVYMISWNTPTTWNVSEVSLSLADTNGNNLNSIAVVKDNVPTSIQGGGDFDWSIPTSIANGTYKIKATVNRRDTSSPSTILSNQFMIGDPIPGGGTNQPPVISGISGPTTLSVNQLGNWTVSASDPNGDALMYEVTWGDGSATPAGTASVLTHTFGAVGTYTVTFKVKDAGGLSAETTKVVTVTTDPTVGGALSVGDRVVVTGNVNVRVEPNGYILGTQGNSVVYSGFSQFGPSKGVVIDGPKTVGSYTWMKVNYDYGPDGWSVVDYLSSLGQISGWAFTSDNLLGRKIQPSQGSIFTEPYYYYVENGQVSIPSNFAQASLPPEALNVLTGIQGGWNCQSISDYPPFRWVGYRCSYRRGNQPPTVNLTGSTSTFTNVGGTWRFTASDPEGALASYKVDWGDGSAVTPVTIDGASITRDLPHTYTQTGTFTIKLTVTDGAGLSAEATLIVLVTTPCSTKFQIGARVQVANEAENGLNVRATPGGTLLGNQQKNALGTVIGGPEATTGYCWWNINYDAAPDGWSAENWLEASDGGGQVGVTGSAGGLAPGGVLNIQWSMPSTITKVHLYLVNYGTIASDVPNTGSYTWNIPSNIPIRNDYLVIIYSAEVGITLQQISSPFAITPGGGNQPGTGGPPGPAGGLNTVGGGPFAICDIVRPTAVLNIRSTPGLGSNVVGQQTPDSQGEIKEGPVQANNYTWWRVDYNYGVDGWSAEAYLALVLKGSCAQPNQPPVVNTFVYTGQTVPPVNTSLPFQARATDPEGSAITYNIDWGDGQTGSFAEASGVIASFAHSYAQAGSYTVRLTALDSQGLSSSATVTVVVGGTVGGNQLPTLSTPTGPTSVTVNTSGAWQIQASDPDDPSLTYTVAWGDGTPNSTYTGPSGQAVTASHTYASTGAKTITVTVSDGRGGTANRTLPVTVIAAGGGNQGPSVEISGPQTPVVGVPNSWQIVAYDPDSTSISFTVSWGDGASDNYFGAPGQQITAAHTYTQSGLRTISVVASDGQITDGESWGVSVLTPSQATKTFGANDYRTNPGGGRDEYFMASDTKRSGYQLPYLYA